MDELHIGPKTEAMVAFWSTSPEFAKREYASYVFKLCCWCLGHVVPKLLSVTLRFLGKNTAEIDLSDIFERLRKCLLSSSTEQNVFISAESISSSVESFNEFGD